MVNRVLGVLVFGFALERNQRKRNSIYIDVFGHKHARFCIGTIVHAPETAAYDLFTQKLALERADPENVRDIRSVPTFREHRHRYDAPDVLSRLSPLPNRADYPPQ